MQITIKFNTDNAAFEDSLEAQCRAIGDAVSARLNTFVPAKAITQMEYYLRDLNGNTIGTLTLEA